jgi:DNA-binding CsgD family transcriptional regulator
LIRGRSTELARLDALLEAARAGQSGTLVLRGEAGIGKTALLDYVASGADEARVLRADGVEAEMELPFAALHQLCAPVLGGLGRLPAPQCDALRIAFGLSSGAQPDRFLVGLAVLTLLSDAAETEPLVCILDDAQWLDRSSAQVLSFVARRLEAEGVLMLFAERDSDQAGELAGLPELPVERLSSAEARELLAAANLGVLDESVRDRIVAEAHGNPLAVLELPRALLPASLAGGFAVSDASPLEGRIAASFRARVKELPGETQRLLLLAAAEPLGDPVLLWRAAAELGLAAEAVAPAEAADLLSLGTRVTFRHPLLRSAIYEAAPHEERRAAHGALANATSEIDPDRRAWHRAYATLAPDEEVAAELERSAERARARGGLAAAAAFLERAAELTPDPRRRAQRALGAARRKRLAGLHEPASALLAMAEQGPLSDLERALALRLRAQIAWDEGPGEATGPLLDAAQRLEPLDVRLARETHLEALYAASNAARLGGGVLAPARAARAAPPASGSPDASDLLLDALAMLFTDGHTAAAPLLREALAKSRAELGRDEHAMRSLRMAARTAAEILDAATCHTLAARHVQIAREDGVLLVLPVTLNYLAAMYIYEGDLDAAAILLDESDSISRSTTGGPGDVMRLLLAAYRGDEGETSRLSGVLEGVAGAIGDGLILTVCEYATAVLHNGLGHYDAAFAAAERAAARDDFSVSSWALPELVEAGVRSGRHDVAVDALESLVERTHAADTDFSHGLEACSRALVSNGAAVEEAYREAIDSLGRTPMRMYLARARLLYGEWLRRANRRTDSRAQLGAAHEFFAEVGADGFAERAARELLATGATPRKRRDDTRGQLTAQEAQIAMLARDGHTNPEIGAQLFLSPRTVEWHLRKVFMKLDIGSRRDLRNALPRERVPAAV